MKRESNFLRIIITMIVIVLFLALAYIAYHYISMFIAKKEAEDAADDFEKEVIIVALEDEEPEEVVETAPQEEVQPTQTQQSSSSSSTRASTKTTTTYKGYSVIGTIQIPKTSVKSVVVDRITPNSISAAVGVLYGAGLNEIGNTVLVAHNYRNGTFFSNNKKLTNGDKIYITDQTGLKVEYEVYNSYITEDTDISYATRSTNRKA